jgi:glycosyltransferase involved in cell wall biosynthesis
MNRSEAIRPLPVLATPEDAVATLRACLSPASFWTPERIGPQEPWLAHAPFAFWLIEALRPRSLVELGTEGGLSYFALCEAVQRCGLNTRCCAVGRWNGDDEAAYRDIAAHNLRRYSSFSTLVRSTFDDALDRFGDATVDLLHVDARFSYKDIKHHFTAWRPKLSGRAVVLFHATNVPERDSGASRLWEELRQIYPHFEFLHWQGLGVLGAGAEPPPAVQELFGASANPDAVAHIRDAYSRLGSSVARADAADARGRVVELETKLDIQAAEAAHLNAELVHARDHAGQLARELAMTQQQLQWTIASTSWRLTWPLRRLGTASPKLASYGRRLMNSISLRRAVRAEAGGVLARRERGWNGGPDLEWLKFQFGSPDSTAEELAVSRRLLETGGLIDEQVYRAAARIEPDVNAADHYLTVGWREGIEPGPQFEGAFLAPYYRSIGFAGPPAITYLRLREHAWAVYAMRHQAEALARLIRSSGWFDETSYAAAVGDLAGLDPVLHYVIVGERMGLAPSGGFDPVYYADRYPDVAHVCRLAHYLTGGRAEGRRPLPLAVTLGFDRSRLKPNRRTVLLVVHEASRTGAPILAYNVAKRLHLTCNVIVVLLAGGELVDDFKKCCSVVIGPLTQAEWHPGEMKHLVAHIAAACPLSYAIVNSIASWICVPALGRALIPVVLLVHEFASYTRPKWTMRDGLDWATEVVFSAKMVAQAARAEHPSAVYRPLHVLPQGRCDLPPGREATARLDAPADLARAFRPPGAEDAMVVLGCGFVHLRKGIDLFLGCAAVVKAMRPRRPVRFVWIGQGYDPENDPGYPSYLATQIAQAGLEDAVAMVGEVADLTPAYDLTDVFFLSSRLDPMPNVTIDAVLHGIPVVCFAGASGMADLLAADASTRPCVVPHLDVQAAARVIADFADDEPKRRNIGGALRTIGQATFDMDRYVRQLDELGQAAVQKLDQRMRDVATISDDALFDPEMYCQFDAQPTTRTEAIADYVTRWTLAGPVVGVDSFIRRPCPGFHPHIYAHAHAGRYDTTAINPLAHFIRSGKPDGPWRHDVILPTSPRSALREAPRAALHAHFHYPELAEDFIRKLAINTSRCDLLLSTDQSSKARLLREATGYYRRGEVHIRVLPNRGRDIGAFLTAFGEDIASRYDIVGHLHGKRSVIAGGEKDPGLGERWREFLWQNLLGDRHPMMDIVIGRLAADETLGLVFADDPHLVEWNTNRQFSEGLAARMGITAPLSPFFDFPIGTMFWARTSALKSLFDLKLGWDDYPPEPLAYDGTILHALERLLPFVARHAGYRFATTHVPGVTW